MISQSSPPSDKQSLLSRISQVLLLVDNLSPPSSCKLSPSLINRSKNTNVQDISSFFALDVHSTEVHLKVTMIVGYDVRRQHRDVTVEVSFRTDSAGKPGGQGKSLSVHLCNNNKPSMD